MKDKVIKITKGNRKQNEVRKDRLCELAACPRAGILSSEITDATRPSTSASRVKFPATKQITLSIDHKQQKRVRDGSSAFSYNFSRRFIFPHPHKLRMPQVTIRRPFGELDLGDQIRLEPDAVFWSKPIAFVSFQAG